MVDSHLVGLQPLILSIGEGVLQDDQNRLGGLLRISARVCFHQTVPVGHIPSVALEGHRSLQGYHILQIGASEVGPHASQRPADLAGCFR